MSTPGQMLREIHRLRRYGKEVQKKIDELPRRLKVLQDRVKYQTDQLEQAKTNIKKLKVKAHEGEVALQSTLEQIAKYQRQLNDIMSKKEYDALKSEIAHAEEKVSALEDEILQTYTEIDDRTAEIPDYEAAVEKATSLLADFENTKDTRHGEFAAELEKTEQLRTDAEAQLPDGELRDQYQRLVRVRGDDAFSPVAGKTCQTCYTEVTTQIYNELLMGKFVLCISCGRIIYASE